MHNNEKLRKLTKPMEEETTWTCIRRTRESDKTLENTLTRRSGQRSNDPLETTLVPRLGLPQLATSSTY